MYVLSGVGRRKVSFATDHSSTKKVDQKKNQHVHLFYGCVKFPGSTRELLPSETFCTGSYR